MNKGQVATYGKTWSQAIRVAYLLPAIMCAATLSARAQNTHYVSKSGDDSNPCTQAQPCRTVNRGLSSLGRGDTLVLGPGKYKEAIDCGSVGGTCIPSGFDWSHPTTIMASPGERVLLRPKAKNNPFRVITLGANLSYIVIDGLVLDGSSVQNSVVKITDGANHIRLKNCEIENSPTSHGVLITDGNGHSSYNEIIDCRIHDNGLSRTPDQSTPHGLYVQTSYNLIDGCEIYNNTLGKGIHFFAGTQDNNIISNCSIHDNLDGFLVVGSYNLIYNNLFYNQGIDIMISDGSSEQCIGNKVYNNTCYNSDGAIRAGAGSASIETTGTLIDNNISWKMRVLDLQVSPDATDTTVSNNLTGGDVRDGGVKTTLSGNIVGDPLFIKTGRFDFHLKSGSPAIDAGMTLLEVPSDKDGVKRPQGNAYCIGAFEFAARGGTGALMRGGHEWRAFAVPMIVCALLSATLAFVFLAYVRSVRKRSPHIRRQGLGASE